jgi:hypothetical protein
MLLSMGVFDLLKNRGLDNLFCILFDFETDYETG